MMNTVWHWGVNMFTSTLNFPKNKALSEVAFLIDTDRDSVIIISIYSIKNSL